MALDLLHYPGVYIMQNTMVGGWPLGKKWKNEGAGGKNEKGGREKVENFIKNG